MSIFNCVSQLCLIVARRNDRLMSNAKLNADLPVYSGKRRVDWSPLSLYNSSRTSSLKCIDNLNKDFHILSAPMVGIILYFHVLSSRLLQFYMPKQRGASRSAIKPYKHKNHFRKYSFCMFRACVTCSRTCLLLIFFECDNFTMSCIMLDARTLYIHKSVSTFYTQC